LLQLLHISLAAASSGDSLASEFIPPAVTSRFEAASPGDWTIFLDGRIDEGSAERLRDALAQRGIESARVFLNSPGGLLAEGIALGRLIRQRGFSTYVGRQRENGIDALAGSCSSACVFAFIGGVYRYALPQSRIGVHRFSSLSATDADPDMAQVISAAIIKYIKEMGVDVDLFDRMSRRGREQLLILTEKDAQQLRVVNAGRLPPEWSIAAADGDLHLTGAQQTSSGMVSVSFSCRGGQVLFRPVLDVDDDAAAAVNSVIRHSIKFGSWLDPLTEAVEPISVQGGHASALFVLGQDQIGKLRESTSIGYAAQLQDLTTFASLSVDTGGNAEKIREFLKNCAR
jgi:ATP-dependent protease ClpP protease subunit